MKRLIAGCVATAVVYLPLALYVDSQVGPSTPAVVLLAGITAATLAGTMLFSTRGWSLRAVGLFLFLVGVTTLLIGGYVNYQWGIEQHAVEYVNDLVLALWLVGSPLSLVGGITYIMGGDRPPEGGE